MTAYFEQEDVRNVKIPVPAVLPDKNVIQKLEISQAAQIAFDLVLGRKLD